MKKTGDAKPINVISETIVEEETYTRDFVKPWVDEKSHEMICDAMKLPEEMKGKNLRVVVKIIP